MESSSSTQDAAKLLCDIEMGVNFPEFLALLQQKKEVCSFADSIGRTPLHWAALHGNLPVVEALLMCSDVKIDSTTSDNLQTPLMWACSKGNLSVVEVLIKHGASLSLMDSKRHNALFLAVQHGHTNVLVFMLHHPPCSSLALSLLEERDDVGSTLPHWAAYHGFVDILRLLRHLGPSGYEWQLDYWCNTPLHRAVQGKAFRAAKFLVDECDTPECSGLFLKNSSRKTAWETALQAGLPSRFLSLVKPPTERWIRWRATNALLSRWAAFAWYWATIAESLFALFVWAIPLGASNELVIVLLCFITLSCVLHTTSYRTVPGVVACDRNAVARVCVLQERGVPGVRDVCWTCVTVKPYRTKHCPACGYCVSRMDHHCIWINACVGSKNHHYFVGFLVSLLCTSCLAIFVFFPACIEAINQSFSTHRVLPSFMMMLNVINQVLWALALTGMLGQQVYCILKNLTLNELFNSHQYHIFIHPSSGDDDKTKGLYVNPFDHGWRANLLLWIQMDLRVLTTPLQDTVDCRTHKKRCNSCLASTTQQTTQHEWLSGLALGVACVVLIVGTIAVATVVFVRTKARLSDPR